MRKRTTAEEPLQRVRRICLALPGVTEKLSHGAPTFFTGNGTGVFTMFVNNHHNDGHVAVWIPAAPGEQERLISEAPEKFFRPPYVGVKGWVGVEMGAVDDEELGYQITEAWRMIAAKKPRARKTATRGLG